MIRNAISLLLFLFYFVFQHIVWTQNTRNTNIKQWTMIDVCFMGMQGDAHYITNGIKHILVDTGAEQYGNKKLIPFLKKHKVTILDAVFITHPHLDHYGGLIPLLQSDIKIKCIYMNLVSDAWVKREWWGVKKADLLKIRKLASKRKIPVLDYSKFDKFEFEKNFVFRKLFIFREKQLKKMGIGPDINELSLIAVLQYKDKRILFTGDLNRGLSNWLIKHAAASLKCDILKVPHHGAEGLASNEFFITAAPAVALIPTTLNLIKGKRTERCRNILKKLKVKTYSSAINGDVSVLFDNNGTFKIIAER